MPAVAAALGVTCDYCHAGRGAAPKVTANGKPRLDVAREMIAMTHALNATVQTAAGKTAREAAGVTCATCHRGVAIPRPLAEILMLTGVREGADAAVDAVSRAAHPALRTRRLRLRRGDAALRRPPSRRRRDPSWRFRSPI